MSDFFKKRLKDDFLKKYKFPERDYIFTKGDFGEIKLFPVHHICVLEDCLVFNDLHLPFGDKSIVEKTGEILEEIFENILPILNQDTERRIAICGNGKGSRILGRKLEDKIKREVYYN